MSEDTSNPPHHVALPVLPSSGKVDQLRQEVAREGAQSEASDARASAAATKEGEPGSEVQKTAPPVQTPRQREIEIKVIGALRGIFDPEIPVNIYDLGLIYEIRVDETDAVSVKMTLTAPACPVAGSLPGEVEAKIEAIPEVRSANVELVWEPAWSKDRMSESAMLDLGFL
jgi:FeS assembly SUF system protein